MMSIKNVMLITGTYSLTTSQRLCTAYQARQNPIQARGDTAWTDSSNGPSWMCKAFYSHPGMEDNILLSQRREFYQIMLIKAAMGRLIIGGNTYHIQQPVLLYVRPNEIISWKNLSMKQGAHYALFKKAFVARYPQFKAMERRIL